MKVVEQGKEADLILKLNRFVSESQFYFSFDIDLLKATPACFGKMDKRKK